MSVMFVQLYF